MASREGNMKLGQLKTIPHDPIKDTHILGITETWLCNEFGDAVISIKGYVHERVDREDRELQFYKDGSGCVIVYISTGREDLESKNLESIWIELTPKHHPSHLIYVAYRSQDHNLNDWYESFSDQVTNAYIEYEQVTIMGDFNIDLLKSDNDSINFLDLMENFQFSKHISKPTRITNKTTTMIDHMFTSTLERVRAVKVAKISISDHFPPIAVFKDSFGSKHTHTSIKYRCYKKINEERFIEDLENALWEQLQYIVNIDESLGQWYKMFLYIVNRQAHLGKKESKEQINLNG